MNWSPSKISNCLVTKVPQTDDLLVAYIISDDSELDIEGIRDYCSKHLRQYMVPSYIVVLDKFSLIAEHARLLLENATLDKTFSNPSQSINIKEGE